MTTNSAKRGSLKKLTPKQLRFVDEYLIDLCGTQAAIRAGYSPRTANEQAARLLANASIKAEIAKRMKDRQERTEITQDMVLRLWWEQATADANELVQYRRLPCEDCWPADAKQETPNPECKSCHGDGFGHVHIADTRTLKGAARRLYNGVQVSKDGMKVLLLDRDKALENVARHLGMFNDKLTLKGDAENPLMLLLKQVSGKALPVVKDGEDE